MSLFEWLLNRQTAYNGLLCPLIDLIDGPARETLQFCPCAIRFLDEISTEGIWARWWSPTFRLGWRQSLTAFASAAGPG